MAGLWEGGTKRMADGKEIVRLSENGSMLTMFLQVLHPYSENPLVESIVEMKRCVSATSISLLG